MIRLILTLPILVYQRLISPVLGPRCRFQPTCSNYALEAIKNLPIHIALYKSVIRIMKCHPFHSGGYDPVIKCEQDQHQPCKKPQK